MLLAEREIRIEDTGRLIDPGASIVFSTILKRCSWIKVKNFSRLSYSQTSGRSVASNCCLNCCTFRSWSASSTELGAPDEAQRKGGLDVGTGEQRKRRGEFHVVAKLAAHHDVARPHVLALARGQRV